MSRALGIVRVSNRDDDTGHSPEVQARAMVKLAADSRWRLTADDILDENVDANGKVRKVSGGWSLEDRPKLAYALAEIEAGRAQVIIAERLDRLFRDFDQQRQFVSRVESAGGQIVTATQGAISHATAETELVANMNGVVAQYTKRTSKDRSWAAVELAIEEGKVPWSQTAPGYLRNEDSTLRPDPVMRKVMKRAFEKRRDQGTIEQVRAYLAENGIERSYHGVQHLLRDRIYLGEIHFGTHTPNLNAHEPIVDRKLFNDVQRRRDPRGRRARSDRLLARLGVLRCAACNARMVVGSSNNSAYFIYRCPPVGDCSERVTISATMVEDVVVAAVREALADETGRAEVAQHARDAQAALSAAQEALDGALRVIMDSGLESEPVAVERLGALRTARDEAQELVDRIGPSPVAVTVNADADWDRLTLDERRALVKATVKRVTVAPGRGPDRITVELFTE